MTIVGQRPCSAGYTLIEVAVITATVILLLVLFLVLLPKQRQNARRTECVSNLKQLGTAFRMWGNDSLGLYPMEKLPYSNSPAYYFQADGDQISSTKILICPADSRRPSTTFSNLHNENVSYFIGLDAGDTYPGRLLSGDRNITLDPTPQTNLWELGTNKNVGWSRDLHNQLGNIGLSDGSVLQRNIAQLRDGLKYTEDPTNRILLPSVTSE